MIEPSLQFQSAVRGALIADPTFAALVEASNVRSGGGRPGTEPCVIFGSSDTELLGYAAGGQLLARVFLTCHVWCPEDGADTGKSVGFALLNALVKPPADGADHWFHDYQKPALAWVRDPSPDGAWTHGVCELEAVVRWKV